MSKKNKRRQCPALGKEITSQECGADRHSRIACTADCAFNTFSVENYDDFGELESGVQAKCRDRLLQNMPAARRSHFAEQGMAVADDILRSNDLFLREFFRRRDADGRSFLDHWAAEGWKGLNNDERVYIECYRRTKPALVQIQCALDDVRLQVVDLLDPDRGPFIIADRSIAGTARRFSTAVWCLFSAPHYTRPCGAGVVIEAVGPFDELEVLLEISRHLSGPAHVAGLSEWLWDHCVMVHDVMKAVMKARRADSLRLTDTKHGTAVYRINDSFADLGEVLEEDGSIEEADLEPGDVEKGFERRYDVFDRPAPGDAVPPVMAMPGDVLLGSILLGEQKVQAEAGSGARFVRLKAHLELVAGGRITFLSEHIEDAGAQLSARSDGTWDPALVPPRLREEPEILLMQQSRISLPKPGEGAGETGDAMALRLSLESISRYPDTGTPALNGLTPREAAADPAMRPALVRLMKRRVKALDDLRYRKRLDVDINDQLAELGLHELIFPPPPLPEVAEEEDEGPEALSPPASTEDLQAQFSANEKKLFPAPPPLRAVLSETDIMSGTEAMDRRFSEPEDMLDSFYREWSILADALEATTQGTLNDDEYTMLTAIAARAAALLFPDGPPAAPVNPRRLTWFFIEEFTQLNQLGSSGGEGAVMRYVSNSPQPNLSLSLCGMLIVAAELEESPLTQEGALKMLPVVKAVLRELCQLPPP